jgi:hypothetical protein
MVRLVWALPMDTLADCVCLAALQLSAPPQLARATASSARRRARSHAREPEHCCLWLACSSELPLPVSSTRSWQMRSSWPLQLLLPFCLSSTAAHTVVMCCMYCCRRSCLPAKAGCIKTKCSAEHPGYAKVQQFDTPFRVHTASAATSALPHAGWLQVLASGYTV